MSSKKKRHISPAYPFFGLGGCIRFVSELHKAVGHTEVLKENALKYMELDPSKLITNRAYAAMSNFRLIDERISGKQKMVSISVLARTILIAQDHSPRKDNALQAAATNYEVIRELRTRWPDSLPDDATILEVLLLDLKFSQRAARSFLPALRETYDYAKLGSEGAASQEEIGAKPQGLLPETPITQDQLVESLPQSRETYPGLREYPILLLGTTAYVSIPIPLSERNRLLIMKWFEDNKEALTYSAENEQKEGENE